ncbi:LacI family DNA-binding transcriptional regulator [Rhodococcus koreensis]|uniref:LacI family DNA-binding transcriptional regulator n=1 Tax=Rhodococcus koreensis TaxID=99653 RepID=UPI00367191F1
MAVTRNDVAREAGVSTAVVSYVLNNGPRPVAPATRDKVLAAIRTLGYRRDGVARHLRVGKTLSIGLVVPDPALPYFAEFTKHLNASGEAADRQILLAASAWDLDREHAILASLAERRVDAIVLLSADPLQDFSARDDVGVPLILVDRPEVVTLGTVAAVEHLRDHGHRRLGLITGPSDLRAIQRRSTAWADAVRGAGLDVHPEWYHHAEISQRGGYEAARALFANSEAPSAIFVESDAQALGFLRGAHECGRVIPADCAIITAEGTENSLYSVPSLTTLAQPVDRLAGAALRAAVEAPAPGMQRISDDEFRLCMRESCGTH